MNKYYLLIRVNWSKCWI